MPEPEANLNDPEALAAAAGAIADAFGLGATTVPSNQWPIDDGDTVLSVSLSGERTGRLYLAVNDQVAARLQNDPSRFVAGMKRGADEFTTRSGLEFDVGEIELVDSAPDTTAEILDGSQLCALVGVTWDAADIAAADQAGSNDDDGSDVVAGERRNADEIGRPFTPNPFEQAITGSSSEAYAAIGPLNLLQDVDMEVTVELGRTRMAIRELLALQPGMVVEIDRAAGAPIDVLVNGRMIACGEVVVVDEEFGIRITEIVGAPT